MALSFLQSPFISHIGSSFDVQRTSVPVVHAITNVHIFDGHHFTDGLGTVIIQDDLICQVLKNREKPSRSCVYDDAFDGQGKWLLPGFIDSHLHIVNTSPDVTAPQRALRAEGATAGLDMGSFPYSMIPSFNERPNNEFPWLWGSGAAATGNASFLTKIPGFPHDSIILDEDDAKTFVANRVNERVDYIKIVFDRILDPNSQILPTPDSVNTLVSKAHKHKKLVIAHSTTYSELETAIDARVDIITHIPTAEVNETVLRKVKGPLIPTLIKMASTGKSIENCTKAISYVNRHSNVKILVGTDAQDPIPQPFVPFQGSLAQEMEYLEKAGLTQKKIILGATEYPVSVFRLGKRGQIKKKYRADLVLVAGNPLLNISAVRNPLSVWERGTRVDLALETQKVLSTKFRPGL